MTTQPRPLPRSLDPLPGEALGGFVLRLAHRLALTPGQVAMATGLTASPQRIPAAHTIALGTRTAEAFARATRLSVSEAHALTLARYAANYPPLSACPPGRACPRPAPAWILTASSRYCPDCLAGGGSPIEEQHGGAWQILWRLPVIFACTEHQRILRCLCPGCARPAFSRRPVPSLVPRPGYPDLHPCQCRHPPHGEPATSRRPRSACGTRLDTSRHSPDDPHAGHATLMQFQARLLDLLHASAPAALSCGAPATPAQYFTDLRLVTRLITASWPAAQPYLSTGHDHLITSHMHTRQPHASDHGATTPIARLYGQPPADPAACGHLLHLASKILSSSHVSEAADLLRPLIHDQPAALHWAAQFQSRSHPCSDALTQALTTLRPGIYSRRARQPPRRPPMPATQHGPLRLPARIWEQEQTQQMLRDRDIRNLLQLTRQHGASQQRIGSATGMAQSRISDIMTGIRQVTALQTFEKIADGLTMPDNARMLLGLAPKTPPPASNPDPDS